MNEQRILEKLAAAARHDKPPPIDVAETVISDLMATGEPPNTMLWAFTGVCSAAAATVTVAAAQKSRSSYR